MKKVLMVVVFMVGFGIAQYSYGNMSCGFKPIPRVGCVIGQCICEGDYCYWQQICN